MQAARISVITPTRNRLAFLREAVASVEAQSLAEWEMIVVDDASEDGTWDWLQSLDEQRVRALRMPQRSERSAARNAGLRAAKGEYVLFLDDDDWLLDRALERLARALQNHPDAVAAVGALIYKNDWGSWNRATHPRRRAVQNVWEDVLFGWVPLQGQTLFHRSVLIRTGGWNEAISLCEDNELWLRLSQLGPIAVIPQSVVACSIHAGQTPRNGIKRLSMEMCRSSLAGKGEAERHRAERCIRARRSIRLAWRAIGRGHPLQGMRWWWNAVVSAPQLLASAPSRAPIVGVAERCLACSLPAGQLTEILRQAKRACLRTFRGELRIPSASIPSRGAVRGANERR